MSEAVDPLDGAFLLLDNGGAAMRIGAVIELVSFGEANDSDQRFHLIRETVRSRIHESPLLMNMIIRSRADLRWPRLVLVQNFDVSYHVRRHTMSVPNDRDQLNDVIGDYLSRPFEKGHPLWQLFVIDGYQPDLTHVVVKIHHSLADGVAGVGAIATLFDLSTEIRSPATVAPRHTKIGDHPSRPGHNLIAAWRARGRMFVRAVSRLAGFVVRRMPSSPQPRLTTARRASWDGEASVEKSWDQVHVSLSEVKQTARRNGGSVTDVVIAIVGGALGEFVRSRGELSSRDLVAFVPINIRARDEIGAGGNQISGMLVRLHVAAPTRQDRVRLIARDTGPTISQQRASRAQLFANVPKVLGPFVVGWGARFLHAWRLYDRLPTVANLMISSVPGPPIPLWFAGQKIASVVPIGPLFAGFSLNVTVLSYEDRLEFGLFAGREQFPDLRRLRDLIEDEARALLASNGDGVESTR